MFPTGVAAPAHPCPAPVGSHNNMLSIDLGHPAGRVAAAAPPFDTGFHSLSTEATEAVVVARLELPR